MTMSWAFLHFGLHLHPHGSEAVALLVVGIALAAGGLRYLRRKRR